MAQLIISDVVDSGKKEYIVQLTDLISGNSVEKLVGIFK